ncbi:hypothetical protein BJ875DRAFT_443692 [Amylocarpus encephaloides]|uniref:Uncharacterized protein n=1 Tax=Amylocarpus encephaloides TaxID=45428 RepID=A0A9P8C2U0_9HELO|nr:hypothetical protein BJ875DRAFT_443692 [Amylocarpus encephaloides]
MSHPDLTRISVLTGTCPHKYPYGESRLAWLHDRPSVGAGDAKAALAWATRNSHVTLPDQSAQGGMAKDVCRLRLCSTTRRVLQEFKQEQLAIGAGESAGGTAGAVGSRLPSVRLGEMDIMDMGSGAGVYPHPLRRGGEVEERGMGWGKGKGKGDSDLMEGDGWHSKGRFWFDGGDGLAGEDPGAKGSLVLRPDPVRRPYSSLRMPLTEA